MELRSSRSRSKTPLTKQAFEGESQIEYNRAVRVTRSTTYRNQESFSTSQDVSHRSARSGRSSRNLKKTITSDYSSEDGENEVTSTDTEQNSRNARIEQQSNGNGMLALKLYREAREYWNRYPKTDYTYSRHSKDRVEIAPGVINMPNMSRESIHKMWDTGMCNKETNTEVSKSRKQFRPRALFTNNNHLHESYEYRYAESTTITRQVFVFIQRIFVGIFSILYAIVEKPNVWFYKLGTILHRTASRIMLFDTWLLQGTGSLYSKKRNKAILWLCLIPLFLLGGLWAMTALGQAAFGETASVETMVPVIDEASLESKPSLFDDFFGRITNTINLGWISNSDAAPKPEMPSEKNENTIGEDQLYKLYTSLQQKYDSDEMTEQVLNNAKFKTFIESNKNEESTAINELKKEIDDLKISLNSLSAKLKGENVENSARLTRELRNCCRRSFLQVERYVMHSVREFLENPVHKDQVIAWLESIFVAKNDLEKRLSKITSDLREDYSSLIENNGKVLMDAIVLKIKTEMDTRLMNANGNTEITLPSDKYIKDIVHEVLSVYDSDKTGLVDYALESSGGQILSIKCTKSYDSYTAVYSLFGIPLWYPTKSPNIVITPGVTPGDCWAFENFPGFLIIKLSSNITVEAFSYEHVSKMLVPNGKIDSAPKNFSVYGLNTENDRDPVLLGDYIYDAAGEQLQYFPVQQKDLVFDVIELRINSNHGNPNYTCLYRFRVHGKLHIEPT